MGIFLIAAIGILAITVIAYVHFTLANPRVVLRDKFRKLGRTTSVSGILALDEAERGTVLWCRNVRLHFWVPERLMACARLPENALLLEGVGPTMIDEFINRPENRVTIVEMEDVAECIDSR